MIDIKGVMTRRDLRPIPCIAFRAQFVKLSNRGWLGESIP